MTAQTALDRNTAYTEQTHSDLRWRLLRLLNLFRITMLGLLLTLDFTDRVPQVFGSHEPVLFVWTAVVYLALALLSGFSINRQQPPLPVQTYTQLSADLVGITLLMHASGGLTSGLGSVLFVPVAAGSLLLGQRMALLFAALASLALLGEQAYAMLEGLSSADGYTQAGLLGAIFFATALVGRRLAARVQESEALAIRRGLDLQNASQLNDYIVQHLATGVVVLAADGSLHQANAAATRYLGLPPHPRGRPVTELSPWLAELWQNWQRHGEPRPGAFPAADSGDMIVPHALPLGSARRGGLLVFLEDSHLAEERVQQTKLAALGRLTASIAHEIRNPLGAIRQAHQLLGESAHLDAEDRRLLRIIETHSRRINDIIESIMQLSRRETLETATLDLTRWLEDFAREYRDSHGLTGDSLRINPASGDIAARVDPRHLQQIMTNLVDNAVTHAGAGRDGHELELRTGFNSQTGETWLEVEDRGPGIPPDTARHIFEPFYTRSVKGTGLGLFIARELCEINRARLSYLPREGGGSVFRISFAAPGQWVT